MLFKSTLSLLLSGSSIALSASIPTDLSLSRRQTAWTDKCGNAPPGNFKAFDLGGCSAQLSFNKDRYVGYQWSYTAHYPDGSSADYKPFQDYNNFGVSDSFYPYLGNNFVTKFPGSSAFTAVHEFSSVCKNGVSPVAWTFSVYATSPACGNPANYRYNSGRIAAVKGASRPPKASPSLRRLDSSGNFEVSWPSVSGASAYSVIVEYPTGTDEVGNPYTNVRGERIQAGGSNRAVVLTGTRSQSLTRKAVVNVVNSQGVWSFTNDVRIVEGRW